MDDSLGALTGAKKPKKKPLAPAAWGLVCENGVKPDPCLHNAVALLRQSYPLRESLTYDDFSGRVLVREVGKPPRPLEEADELQAARWLQRSWNSRFSSGLAATALRDVALQQRVDVLVEHVRRVKWDGVARVDTFAVRYLGCEDTPYHRAVGRVLLLSMAARALRPGCQVDTLVVLEGAQGCGKSTLVKVLAGAFFAELEGTFGSKDAAEQVEGAWLVELPELQALSRAEVTAIKSFATRANDRFRRAYARTVTDVPRRSVMVGTTNADAYLRDETGGRRFLPIVVVLVALALLRAERDQLIAEAVARVDAGEAWHITDEGVAQAAAEAARDRYESDPWEADLASFLAIRPRVTVADCLSHLRIEAHQKSGATQTRCAKLLVFLGYRRIQIREGNSRKWLYSREAQVSLPGASGDKGAEMVTRETLQKPGLSPQAPQAPSDPSDSPCARAGEVSEGAGDSGDSGDSGDVTPRQRHAFSDLLDGEDQ